MPGRAGTVSRVFATHIDEENQEADITADNRCVAVGWLRPTRAKRLSLVMTQTGAAAAPPMQPHSHKPTLPYCQRAGSAILLGLLPRSGHFPHVTHSVRSQSPCSATKSAGSRRQALMSGNHHLRSCQCQCAIHIRAPGASSPPSPFRPASFVWLCGSSERVT